MQKEFITCQQQYKYGHVMTETIFAGEQIKELSLQNCLTSLTLSNTIFTRLFKHFFMRYRPGNTGNRQRKYE